MALFFADLVREASWGTGDGDLPLGGALPGHRGFAEAVPAGARFHYAICGVTHPDEWETGEGEIGEDGALARTPIASSADGAAVDFSAGLKTVALTVAAAWFSAREAYAGDPADLAGKADLAGADFAGPVSAPRLDLATPLAISDGGTGAADAAGARAALGLTPGVDIEPHDPRLTALAGLDATTGLVEQTGAASFAKRAIGVAGDGDLLSRGDGDARYQPLDDGLGALAALATQPFGRGLLTLGDAAAARVALGLGTAAQQNIGTSGGVVPLVNGSNNWGAGQSFPSATFGDASFTLRINAGATFAFVDMGGVADSFAYSRATDEFQWYIGGSLRGSLNAGGLAIAGTISAGGLEVGYRDLPRVTAALERGKCLAVTAGITIATAAAGQAFHIYNNSGAAVTLTQGSGLTLRLAGTATTGNRTLAARGFATIWFNSATEAVAMGYGLT